MTSLPAEFDELRITIERLRTLLEHLVVRGLRACGEDELLQLKTFAEHLEQAGAGHVASMLAQLHARIASDDRGSAQTLLAAQTAVRLLERLLTLRVVGAHYDVAVAALAAKEQGQDTEDDTDDSDDAGEAGEADEEED